MRSSWPEGRREVTQYGQSKPKLVSCYSLHSALSYAVRPDCLSQQCFIVTERAERRELCTNISNSWILFNACQFWRCVVSTRLIINSCHLAVIKISFDKSWYSVRSMIMPFWLSYGYGAHFAFYGHWNSDMELRWGAPASGRLPLCWSPGPVRLVTSVPTWSTSPDRLQPRPPIGPQCPGWGQFVIGWDSGDTVTRDSIGHLPHSPLQEKYWTSPVFTQAASPTPG